MPSGEQRKTVTILFCDVAGSTSLGESVDPEALRALLARYFDRLRLIVERHGGTVEKFVGDAVMAVFGVPKVHEDDALRAVRAAMEMRDALPELGVEARIGVNTGEVVAGTTERLVTGDAVNVAKRLEEVARPGSVLIGARTLELVRESVEVGPAKPLVLKGKQEPVLAFVVGSVSGERGTRRLDAPLVGRRREWRLLRETYERALTDRSCHLFTLLGVAGVGKSRLAREFVEALEGAQVVRGRCLSYGDGITYWPVVEVVKQLRPEERELSATHAAALGGLLETRDSVSKDEIAFAVCGLFEAAAHQQPLVVVFDDAHWGEDTFLDLVEHVSDLSRGAPILLLCLGRPELLDVRPTWGGGKLNATTALLEPLAEETSTQLLDNLLGNTPLDDSSRERVFAAADGNPLFIEEMVTMIRTSGDKDLTVPPTVQALLAARLDLLGPEERGTLACCSVGGMIFHRAAVQALAPDQPHVAAHLLSLVRKDLIRPVRGRLARDDGFRFRHILIREAAY